MTSLAAAAGGNGQLRPSLLHPYTPKQSELLPHGLFTDVCHSSASSSTRERERTYLQDFAKVWLSRSAHRERQTDRQNDRQNKINNKRRSVRALALTEGGTEGGRNARLKVKWVRIVGRE